MGENGSYVATLEYREFVPSVKMGGVVDTTGAGDAFAAGFITARLKGLNFSECSRQGHEIASRVIQTVGAR